MPDRNAGGGGLHCENPTELHRRPRRAGGSLVNSKSALPVTLNNNCTW
jgi:hypothetical protein